MLVKISYFIIYYNILYNLLLLASNPIQHADQLYLDNYVNLYHNSDKTNLFLLSLHPNYFSQQL